MRKNKLIPLNQNGAYKSSVFNLFRNSLAFLFFNFVTSEIFLRFGENDMFSQHRIVFLERQLIRRVHGIFLRIVSPNPRLFRDETDQFSLSIILLCHNSFNYITHFLKNQQEIRVFASYNVLASFCAIIYATS